MIDKLSAWSPPKDWQRITTLDVHTEGEPLRIITGGFPALVGKTILQKREYAKKTFDTLRSFLMAEPRGHADMYGCIVTPPVSSDADLGVLFLHNEGYSTMCGHGVIGLASALVQTGAIAPVEPETKIVMDTPAGKVTAFVRVQGGKVASAFFHNVPSFVDSLGRTLEMPGFGKIHYDVAFGGAYYAYLQADQLGLTCASTEYRKLIETGMAIKKGVMQSIDIVHPVEKELGFLYGVIFIAPPMAEGVHSRNVCIFADGQVDRSPTGTGVSGRMALHFARGEVGIGESLVIESIIGSRFTGRVARETTFGSGKAIIPEVEGRAFITGKHEFLLDPKDLFPEGFILS